jgi:hypothetical protein
MVVTFRPDHQCVRSKLITMFHWDGFREMMDVGVELFVGMLGLKPWTKMFPNEARLLFVNLARRRQGKGY